MRKCKILSIHSFATVESIHSLLLNHFLNIYFHNTAVRPSRGKSVTATATLNKREEWSVSVTL